MRDPTFWQGHGDSELCHVHVFHCRVRAGFGIDLIQPGC